MTRRIHSFVWSGILAAALITLGIVFFVQTSEINHIFVWGALAVLGFTLLSCLILDNNFLGEMMLDIFSWSFVTMPGLIFTLDLDGIIWLLTVKLLFWLLGFVLGILCGIWAITLGLLLSVFVDPFALYKNIKHGEEA